MSTPPQYPGSQVTAQTGQIRDMILFTGPRDAILADLDNIYVACPGTPLYDVPCTLCQAPLASRPFVFHVLISQIVCPDGYGHTAAVAITRHADCVPARDDDLCLAALTTARHHDTA